MESGWDNEIFRLGDDLAVRLPRRSLAAPLVGHEQRWLPALAPRLALPIPAPVRTGTPGPGYPWAWSIVPWFPGRSLGTEPLDLEQARRLGAFMRTLHHPAPAGSPANPYRGVPLSERAGVMHERLAFLAESGVEVPDGLLELWGAALAAEATTTDVWLHGDLHPGNILVQEGVITAVIDWGDICAGDAATDLAILWMAIEDEDVRAGALSAYGSPDEASIARARGWAAMFGVMLLAAGISDRPRDATMGGTILLRVTATA